MDKADGQFGKLTEPRDAVAVSPCVGRCTLDRATGYCAGCLRTVDEIIRWMEMGPAARRVVLAALPARRSAPATPRGL